MKFLALLSLLAYASAQTIVDLAVATPQLSTVTNALVAYGLDSVLSAPGAYTVFAPLNSAFRNLGLYSDGTMDGTNIDIDILLNHVLIGREYAGDLIDGNSYTTLSGFDITYIALNGAMVDAGGRSVPIDTTDINATNGVVHLVNDVLLPGTIVDGVVSMQETQLLTTAVVTAGLDSVLSTINGITVFAPTNDSFLAVPTLDLYLNAPQKLGNLLTYHVIDQVVMAANLTNTDVTTLNGFPITIDADNVMIIDFNGISCNIIKSDILRSNGVIHIIDCVLTYQTIVDVIANSSDHGLLTGAVLSLGYDAILSGPGPFTVFAPVDSAFANVPNKPLNYTVLYHVVAGAAVPSAALVDGQVIGTAFLGITLEVDLSFGVQILDTTGNPALVIAADLFSTNGIVHATDAIFEYGNLVDYVIGSAVLNSLQAAVVAAGLVATLSDPTAVFTILAPNDNAFSMLESLDVYLEPGNEAMLAELLTYHVIAGAITSDMLSNDQVVDTLQGGSLTVGVSGNMVTFTDQTGNVATVVKANVVTSNGVIHIIDSVLRLYPDTVQNIIDDSDDHLTLSFLLGLTGLNETLKDATAVTVFAPTDDAFNAVPDKLLNILASDPVLLTNVLLYHVVGSSAPSSSLNDGDMLDSLFSPYQLTVKIDNGVYIMDGAGNMGEVTVPDLMAVNGYVHVIDTVLLPYEIIYMNIVETVNSFENLTTLYTAVGAAGLVDALSDNTTNLTVLAPNNKAFDMLDNGVLDRLLANTEDLADLLGYHVIPGYILSSDLSDGATVTTLQGEDLTVKIDGGVYFVDANGDESMVIQADIMATNGVIHIINNVLAFDDEILMGETTTTTGGGDDDDDDSAKVYGLVFAFGITLIAYFI